MQYGGMDASEATRLKQLEEENARLKKLLAEQMLAKEPDKARWYMYIISRKTRKLRAQP